MRNGRHLIHLKIRDECMVVSSGELVQNMGNKRDLQAAGLDKLSRKLKFTFFNLCTDLQKRRNQTNRNNTGHTHWQLRPKQRLLCDPEKSLRGWTGRTKHCTDYHHRWWPWVHRLISTAVFARADLIIAEETRSYHTILPPHDLLFSAETFLSLGPLSYIFTRQVYFARRILSGLYKRLPPPPPPPPPSRFSAYSHAVHLTFSSVILFFSQNLVSFPLNRPATTPTLSLVMWCAT